MCNHSQAFDTDTIEAGGYRFGVEYFHDPDVGAPWENFDGHGIVSKWTTRDKKPGEKVLIEDRQSKRYYDVRESMACAIRDQWGCACPEGTHTTRRQTAACAVAADFAFLRGWCRDEWHYAGVRVTWIKDNSDDPDETKGEPLTRDLWGVETLHDYHKQTAKELIDELLGEIEVDEPDVLKGDN